MNFKDIELPSNRKFGLFFAAIFFAAGLYFYLNTKVQYGYPFLGVSVVFILTALLKADLLLPLNKLWMRFGMLLGMVISPIVLGIIFFGLFTPISIMMKIFGRDELRLKLGVRASHWKEKESPRPPAESFKNQF